MTALIASEARETNEKISLCYRNALPGAGCRGVLVFLRGRAHGRAEAPKFESLAQGGIVDLRAPMPAGGPGQGDATRGRSSVSI